MWPLHAGKTAGTDGFELGIITDELTDQLDQALDFISSYDLHWCELREIWANNIMNSPQEDLDHAKSFSTATRSGALMIASPIFKWNLPQMPAKANEKRDEFKASFVEADSDKLLEKGFRLARFFGTHKSRIFSSGTWKIPIKPILTIATGWRRPLNWRLRTISF